MEFAGLRDHADCKSAIRQITNLRYGGGVIFDRAESVNKHAGPTMLRVESVNFVCEAAVGAAATDCGFSSK